MIKLTLIVQKDQIQRFILEGHAQTPNNHSYNKLCLAVSILSRTITRYLELHAAITQIVVEDGLLTWDSLKPQEDLFQSAVSILILGLSDLQREWPKELEIITKEE